MSLRLATALAALVAMLGSVGCGKATSHGRCAVGGVVREALGQAPVAMAGVAIVGRRTLAATTDATGRFRIDDEGEGPCRELRIVAAGHVAAVAPIPAGDLDAIVDLVRAEAQARPVARLRVRGGGEVGYGNEGEVAVELDPPDPAATARWSQIEGPPLAMVADGLRLRFVLPTLAELGVQLPSRGAAQLALSARVTPRYAFRVEVVSHGETLIAGATAMTATAQADAPRAVLGMDRYLAVGPEVAQPRWRLAARPGGSHAEIVDAESRAPHLRPDQIGPYVVVEESSGARIELFAGRYLGAAGCGRAECHPREYAAWGKTSHATVFQRGVTGELGPGYGEACWRCHTLGAGQLAVGWGGVPAPGDAVGGVQCEHCHGAGRFWTGFSSEVCAECHDAPPRYALFEAWRSAVPDDRVGTAPGRPGATSGCAKCHTAQGFALSAPEWTAANAAVFAEPRSPHACVSCHDPHAAERPAQLRVVGGNVDAGMSTPCIACHGSPAPAATQFAQRAAPHAGMTAEIVLGSLPVAAPPAAAPGCVDCHMRHGPQDSAHGHSFRAGVGARCETCPPPGDAAKVQRYLAEAQKELARAVLARGFLGCDRRRAATLGVIGDELVLVDSAGRPLRSCDGARVPVDDADRAIYEVAFTLIVLGRDKALAAHNPGYAEVVAAAAKALPVAHSFGSPR